MGGCLFWCWNTLRRRTWDAERGVDSVPVDRYSAPASPSSILLVAYLSTELGPLESVRKLESLLTTMFVYIAYNLLSPNSAFFSAFLPAPSLSRAFSSLGQVPPIFGTPARQNFPHSLSSSPNGTQALFQKYLCGLTVRGKSFGSPGLAIFPPESLPQKFSTLSQQPGGRNSSVACWVKAREKIL